MNTETVLTGAAPPVGGGRCGLVPGDHNRRLPHAARVHSWSSFDHRSGANRVRMSRVAPRTPRSGSSPTSEACTRPSPNNQQPRSRALRARQPSRRTRRRPLPAPRLPASSTAPTPRRCSGCCRRLPIPGRFTTPSDPIGRVCKTLGWGAPAQRLLAARRTALLTIGLATTPRVRLPAGLTTGGGPGQATDRRRVMTIPAMVEMSTHPVITAIGVVEAPCSASVTIELAGSSFSAIPGSTELTTGRMPRTVR